MSDRKDSSEKITRTFRIRLDTFNRFKAETASQGYPRYSEILEYLVLCFLKEPEKYNPYKN